MSTLKQREWSIRHIQVSESVKVVGVLLEGCIKAFHSASSSWVAMSFKETTLAYGELALDGARPISLLRSLIPTPARLCNRKLVSGCVPALRS